MAEITYTQEGDYFLPNIVLSDPPDAKPLTKYGMMRKRFLKEHRPVTYGRMLIAETLYPHCREAQCIAENRIETMMLQLIERSPLPDNATDSLTRVAHMNTLKSIAEENILEELIYE